MPIAILRWRDTVSILRYPVGSRKCTVSPV